MYVQRIRKKVYSILPFICPIIGFILCDCTSTRISDNGISTTEIRDGISELEKQQLDSQRTELEIKQSGKDIEQSSIDIGETIKRQTIHYRNIDKILQQIREQPAN